MLFRSELPATLDETYERVLKEINKANREHAHRLLQCLTVALRPLRVDELAEVLAIDIALDHEGIPELNPNWRWANQHQALLSTCSSLIAITGTGRSKVVQFSHFSVREYLTSDRLAHSSRDISRYHIILEPAHTVLAQACLCVLLRLDDRVASMYNVYNIPLAEYAVRHWIDHARFENVASHTRAAMEYFFDSDKPHWIAWSRVQMIDVSWDLFTPHSRKDNPSPLYYAALGGFDDLVEHLIDRYPEHANTKGGQLVTPLVAALHGKHFQVAESLHRHGADVDVRGHMESTPLYEACRTGVLDTVEWLLIHGADVHARDRERWVPLHGAADWGQLQAVKMLIERNADIHIRNEFGTTPLHLAASAWVKRNQVDIMQVLLDHGANPNARDDDDATPLHNSSWWKKPAHVTRRGTVEGVCLLLKHGAIIDAEDNQGRTPLQLALEYGRDDIAACLKEHGATR